MSNQAPKTIWRKCLGCGRALKFTPSATEILSVQCSICNGPGWQRIPFPSQGERWNDKKFMAARSLALDREARRA